MYYYLYIPYGSGVEWRVLLNEEFLQHPIKVYVKLTTFII
jgi:hypothetical protein